MHKILLNHADSSIGKKMTREAVMQNLDVTLVGDKNTESLAKKFKTKYITNTIDLKTLPLRDYWALINCDSSNISENILEICEQNKINVHSANGDSIIHKYPKTDADIALKKKILLMICSNSQ